MIGRGDEAERLAPDREGADTDVDERIVGDGDVRLAVGDGVHHALGAAKGEGVADAGMDGEERPEAVMDEVGNEAFGADDPHPGPLHPAQPSSCSVRRP